MPPELERIIYRCLEKDRERRYQSARELQVELKNLKRQLDSVMLSAGGIPSLQQKGLRRWMIAAVVAVLLGMVGLARCLFLWRGQTTTLPAGSVADRQAARLSTGTPPSANPEANEYYEKGLMFMQAQSDFRRSRQMMGKALELDPHFAEARARYNSAHN
jgi:hypothetical protein